MWHYYKSPRFLLNPHVITISDKKQVVLITEIEQLLGLLEAADHRVRTDFRPKIIGTEIPGLS